MKAQYTQDQMEFHGLGRRVVGKAEHLAKGENHRFYGSHCHKTAKFQQYSSTPQVLLGVTLCLHPIIGRKYGVVRNAD